MVWVQIVADLLIGLACLVVVGLLLLYHRRRPSASFRRLWLLVGAFLLGCAVCQFMDVLNRVAPAVDFTSAMQLGTALAAWAALLTLAAAFPRLLEIPTVEQLEREIAQRRAAEEALRGSEALFKELFESAPESMVLIDAERKIIRVNEHAETLFGWTGRELLGRPMACLLQDGPAHGDKSAARTVGSAIELTAVRKDGREFPVDILLGQLRSRGERLGLATIRDISRRKRTEAELRRAHDELEQRVRERTAQLARANETLHAQFAKQEHAAERLQASLREKEVLLREVHHRVKNNLQVISSLLAMQSRYVKDPHALELFKESQNRVKSIATVHQKLYQAPDLARIDCAEYLTQLGAGIFRSYGVNADAVKLAVHVDDVQLGIDTVIPCGLIVNELITNSLKHAFPDDRRGLVHVDLAARGGGGYCLTVGDDGVGMNGCTDLAHAESLGLQIVATLTEQLDGRLDVSSNGGTEFRITFKELNYTPRR